MIICYFIRNLGAKVHKNWQVCKKKSHKFAFWPLFVPKTAFFAHQYADCGCQRPCNSAPQVNLAPLAGSIQRIRKESPRREILQICSKSHNSFALICLICADLKDFCPEGALQNTIILRRLCCYAPVVEC